MSSIPNDSSYVNVPESNAALLAKEITNEVEAANIDLYNEDKAEIKYLLSKPVSFVVLGKPGCGKSTLAKKLAEYWRCELINGNS